MAFTAGFSVNVGDPTKATDVTTLAANDDFLKTAIDKIMVDSATPTFALVDGVTATTQSAGNDSTKLATTAYADAAGASLSGTTNDTVVTVTGANAMQGEANLTFDGSTLAVTGTATATSDITGLTLNATGDTAASDNAAIGYTSAEGLILTGQGSTNDVTIKNDADTTVVAIKTGGTNTDLLGTAGVGIARTDGTFHVHTATAGTVTAEANFDELILENSGASGMTILGSTGSQVGIAFGDSDDADNGRVAYNNHANPWMHFWVDGSERMRIDSAGLVSINDTSNANMTQGLTLNQAANDDEILAFKSSDAAHGATTLAETDTYGFIRKRSATGAGLEITGISDDTQGAYMRGTVTNEDTTDTSSSKASIVLYADKINGSITTALSSTANMFMIEASGVARLILKANGVLHLTNTTLVALDDEDDIGLVRAFQKASSRGVGLVMSKWDELMKENEDDLRRVGVLSSESDFVIQQNFNSLIGGSVWQLYTKLQETKEFYQDKIAALESRLMRLEN